MGATDWVSAGLRRAASGVRSAVPGRSVPVEEAQGVEPTQPRPGPAEAPLATGAPATTGAPPPTATPGPPGTGQPPEFGPAAAAPARPVPRHAATRPTEGPAPGHPGTPPRPAPARRPAGSTAGAPSRPPGAATSAPAATPGATPAMPGRAAAADPGWSAEELAEFRVALDADIERLRDELHMGEEDLAGLIADSGDGAGDDQADAGSKTFERENEMWVNANTRDMLDQALRARRRLDSGTYGLCESCGRAIPAGRLRAFPRATLCIACKQAEERR